LCNGKEGRKEERRRLRAEGRGERKERIGNVWWRTIENASFLSKIYMKT
jgi:hypothetical protein